MSAIARTAVAALMCLAVPASVLHAADAKAAATQHSAMAAKAGAKPVMMLPDGLKWEPNPGDPTVKMAVLWGDAAMGPHGAFHKFPAGFLTPLHTHSAELRIVVISGTMAMAGEDGIEHRFPAGSYYTQPTTFKHTTKCLEGSECIALVVANGKFDLNPVDKQKGVSKK